MVGSKQRPTAPRSELTKQLKLGGEAIDRHHKSPKLGEWVAHSFSSHIIKD